MSNEEQLYEIYRQIGELESEARELRKQIREEENKKMIIYENRFFKDSEDDTYIKTLNVDNSKHNCLHALSVSCDNDGIGIMEDVLYKSDIEDFLIEITENQFNKEVKNSIEKCLFKILPGYKLHYVGGKNNE